MATLSAVSYPISQYVLKVHSRCDLACDHCYVYEHADQSWTRRPRLMSADTVTAAAQRIAEHAQAMSLSAVHVVLHGGEPLLMGYERLRETLGVLRDIIGPVTRLNLHMQTNGVRLTERLCALFLDHGLRVGVSLDGDRAANDRHRRFANGASSYAQVGSALSLLRQPEYRAIYSGILCTVDLANDPIAVYEALAAQDPPRIDLLLPHATWDEPPPRPAGVVSPYADWLLRVYRRWSADGQPMAIRLFDSIHASAAGEPSQSEWLGLGPADLLVIETDGAWEQADTLKTAYAGAPETETHVSTHAVAEVAALPAIVRRQVGLTGLSSTCRSCPVVTECGGGLFAHRYSSASGFDNPSVFCADLKELIVAIKERQAGRVAAADAEGHGLRPPDRSLLHLVEQVATGGDAESVGRLADLQVAYTRTLVAAVARAYADDPMVKIGWDLLTSAERADAEAVEAVLRHPFIRPWAVACLKSTPATGARGVAYLTCVAAAAAVRSGLEAPVPVSAVDGRLSLPTIGSLAAPAWSDAEIWTGRGGFDIRAGDGGPLHIGIEESTDDWLPARFVEFDGLSFLLEDTDPFRDCHDHVAPEPVGEAAAGWYSSLRAAWARIAMEAPARLDGLRVGLRAVVPLVADPTGRYRSSTARHAFGSVAMAPAPVEAVAVMLVHELQHSMLGALLDVVELYDPRYTPRLTVGWRPDPRPLEGALQGTFAHAAVTQLWWARQNTDRDGSAAAQFAMYRDWTAQAVDVLLASGGLTPAGRTFVDLVGQSLPAAP